MLSERGYFTIGYITLEARIVDSIVRQIYFLSADVNWGLKGSLNSSFYASTICIVVCIGLRVGWGLRLSDFLPIGKN